MPLEPRYPFFLAGKAVLDDERLTQGLLPVTDKFSGKVVSHVSQASPLAIEEAIVAASAAKATMRALPPHARKAALRQAESRLRSRAEELAQVLAVEAGKPIRDARGEVTRLIDTFDIAAEEAVRIDGDLPNLEISPRATGYRGFTKRVPVGVCSFITPFNFPLNLVAHKVAPAIAAGCPFILKPSDRTPVGALLIGEALASTDLPAGAFSILPTPLANVAPFISDPRIALLSFTGSDKVGWDLKARAGAKKVVLELGGNAACIVDEDQGARLEHVVDRLVFGGFYQSGQSCISVQRILVHRSLYDELLERLVDRVRRLVAGDPKEESTFLGPLIDEAAAVRLESWIREAQQEGARVLCGGGRAGVMLQATVLEGVPHDQPLYAEEAFGPVVLLEPFDAWEAALATVNASKYGLQAGVFTNNLAHSMQAWDELEVGGVIVGDVPSFRVDNMPYGGVKGSGLGREGVKYAINDMTETRLLVIREPDI